MMQQMVWIWIQRHNSIQIRIYSWFPYKPDRHLWMSQKHCINIQIAVQWNLFGIVWPTSMLCDYSIQCRAGNELVEGTVLLHPMWLMSYIEIHTQLNSLLHHFLQGAGTCCVGTGFNAKRCETEMIQNTEGHLVTIHQNNLSSNQMYMFYDYKAKCKPNVFGL